MGYVFSIMAAVAYGAVAVVAKFGIKELATPLVGATISYISGTIMLCAVSRKELAPILKGRSRAVRLLYLAGLLAGLAQIAMYLALSKAEVVLVSPLVGTYPLVTIAVSGLLIQRLERISLSLVLGAVLIVVGGAVVVLA